MAEGRLLQVTADEVYRGVSLIRRKRQSGRPELPQVQAKLINSLPGDLLSGGQLDLGHPRCDLPGDSGPNHCLHIILLATLLLEERLASTFVKLNLHPNPPLSGSGTPDGSVETLV